MPGDDIKPGHNGTPDEIINPNKSRAKFSKIKTDEEEAEEKRQKLQRLDNMVSAKIDEKMETIKTEINQELQNFFNQIQQPQQTNQGQQVPTAPQINDMPPEMKADVLAKVGTSIAQVIQAWKGTGGNPNEDPFGAMSKNMMLQIIQAGLDGIFKQVYPTYNPIPPTPQRFNPIQTPQTGKMTFE